MNPLGTDGTNGTDGIDMNDDEKAAQLIERNASICGFYQQGHKLSECASKFKLGRQRVLQILKEGGVWIPYAIRPRATKAFLGVSVDEDTKDALTERAKEQGVTVSKLADDILSDALAGPTPATEP